MVKATTVTKKNYRLVNPHHTRQAASIGAKRAPRNAPQQRRASNPLFLLGASVNPTKGGHNVAQKKKQPAKQQQQHQHGKKTAARKSTPTASARPMQTQYKPKRRISNPDIGATLAKPIELLKFGLIALFGLVATRQVPQMALGVKNESWPGYAANLGTALAGAYGTAKFAGKGAGAAFGIGGGLYTVNRILTDKLTPVGRVLSLAGVGDAQASASLGRIVPGSLYPPSYDKQGNLQLPPAFIDAARKQLLPPPATTTATGTGMNGVRRGRLAA